MRNPDRLIDELYATVAKWRGKRILVFGDMILDEYIFGSTSRVSREAPVVIVRYDSSSFNMGGAANAAQNIASLGGNAIAVGFIGNDASGEQLKRLMSERGVSIRSVVTLKGRYTTTKMRVMAGDYHAQRQQMVRIDREQDIPIDSREESRLLSAFERELRRSDAVILSDYHQAIFTENVIRKSIEMCRQAGVPVIADSRFHLRVFRGVTTATPNEVEAASAVGMDLCGEDTVERAGRKLLKILASQSVLITRGRFGMSLLERGKKIRSVDVVGTREATDVTGAGDTVVSAVALTLAAGGSMFVAMHLANIAASIVVMKRGTAIADTGEILATIEEMSRRSTTG